MIIQKKKERNKEGGRNSGGGMWINLKNFFGRKKTKEKEHGSIPSSSQDTSSSPKSSIDKLPPKPMIITPSGHFRSITDSMDRRLRQEIKRQGLNIKYILPTPTKTTVMSRSRARSAPAVIDIKDNTVISRTSNPVMPRSRARSAPEILIKNDPVISSTYPLLRVRNTAPDAPIFFQKKCPICGSIQLRGNFCGKCGKQLNNKIEIIPSPSKRASPLKNFCGKCGKKKKGALCENCGNKHGGDIKNKKSKLKKKNKK